MSRAVSNVKSEPGSPRAEITAATRLFRRFLVLSVGALVAILLLTALGLRTALRDATIRQAQTDASLVTRVIGEMEGARILSGLSDEEREEVDRRMRAFGSAFGLARVRVFDHEGRLVYVFNAGEPDEARDARMTPIAADGVLATRLGRRHSLITAAHDIWGTRPNPAYRLMLAATYLPFRDAGPAAAFPGSVEVCKDVTVQLREARRTLAQSLAALGGALLLVFSALTVVMRRAQRTIVEGAESLAEARARSRAEEALRAIVEGTAAATGEGFFGALVERLAGVFNARYAFAGEVVLNDKGERRIRLLALWSGGSRGEIFEYAIAGSPCESVLDSGIRFYPQRVLELFPDNPTLAAMGVQAYIGAPVTDSRGVTVGLIGALHDEAMPPAPEHEPILRIFAARAGAELERLRAERALEESREQLRVAERLASIGALAAGVGHDLNNLLLPMRGQLRSLLASADNLPPAARDNVRALAQSVEFLRQMGESLRMLAESGSDTREGVALRLDQWWAQIGSLLSKAIPSRIALHVDLPPSLPPVRIGAPRLTQAVLNLLINAADAIGDHGHIHLSARHTHDAVRLEVADSGPGMPPDVARHAFEPFFTTKTRGASTGLGLTLVQSIVKSVGGSADIHSRPGKGAVVALNLPIAHDAGQPAPTAATASVSASDSRLAAYTAALLASAGFNVCPAGAGKSVEAALWVVDPASIDLHEAKAFLAADRRRRVLVLGHAPAAWRDSGVVELGEAFDADALRLALLKAGFQPNGATP